MSRPYDLVLFGATGFTGGIVAEYLATHVRRSDRWAIAGRDREKLEALRHRLAAATGRTDVGVVVADVGDLRSLLEMARSARVVLSTVGPYALYGEPVVKACVEAGTHHCDITGEPAFLDLLERRYHEAARAKGVRLINCCGLDSIPADVGAFFTAQKLPAHEEKTVRGYLATNALPSAGTVHSALAAIAEGQVSLAFELMTPVGAVSSLPALEAKIHRVPELGAWALPMPLVDGKIVARSMNVHPVYGPRFQYAEYFLRDGLPSVVAMVTGVVSLVLAAKTPPTRWVIEKLARVGSGPSAARRERGWFTFTFIGESPSKRVITRLRGGDPGYDEASKMLAECGLAIVEQEASLTREYGVTSPVGALGGVLVSRLEQRGIVFEVLEEHTKSPTKRRGSDAIRAN